MSQSRALFTTVPQLYTASPTVDLFWKCGPCIDNQYVPLWQNRHINECFQLRLDWRRLQYWRGCAANAASFLIELLAFEGEEDLPSGHNVGSDRRIRLKERTLEEFKALFITFEHFWRKGVLAFQWRECSSLTLDCTDL